MIKSLKISKKLEDYIAHHSYELNPIQKEIINHNEKMGSQKKMQISVTQGYFFQFFIKSFNIKKVLEIGTFTGYSSLTIALALPKNGHITCLDKNKTTSTLDTEGTKVMESPKEENIIAPPDTIEPKLDSTLLASDIASLIK